MANDFNVSVTPTAFRLYDPDDNLALDVRSGTTSAYTTSDEFAPDAESGDFPLSLTLSHTPSSITGVSWSFTYVVGYEYAATEDETVDSNKTYYAYSEQDEAYEEVEPSGTENPSTEGWYERGDAIMDHGDSTVSDDGGIALPSWLSVSGTTATVTSGILGEDETSLDTVSITYSYTVNQSRFSMAFGSGTKASSKDQLALGRYNVEDSSGSNALIIGNGSSDSSRFTSLAMNWSGMITVYGKNMQASRTPSSDEYCTGFRIADKDGVTRAYMQTADFTTGNQGVALRTMRPVNGTNVYNGFHMAVKPDGSRIVAFNSPDAWRSALGNWVHRFYVVTKSGSTAPVVGVKDTDIDTSKANNGISSSRYPAWHATDDGDRIIARLEAQAHSNGNTGFNIYARNYNTSGNQVAQKGIKYLIGKDGTGTWTVNDPDSFRSAISALGLAGGTLTGNLYFKTDTINRDGANPSADQGSKTIYFTDKDDENLALFNAYRRADGRIDARIVAYNEKSNGDSVYNTLQARIAKDGTCSYYLSDEAAFRNAIGASSGVFPAAVGGTGSAYYDKNPPADVDSSNVSVASGTNTTLATMTITSPGKYIIHAGFHFASNATGRRVCGLSFDDTTGLGARTQTCCVPAANGYQTMVPMVRVVNTSGTSYKIRANVYQNSGSTINCTVYMYAFRLK